MLVVRVEHKENKRGPYNNEDYSLCISTLRRHNGDEYPNWRDDGLNGYYDEVDDKLYVCGFDSEEKCLWWFENWWYELESNNYVICFYETDDYKMSVSGKQLSFDINKAKIIKQESPLKFAKEEDISQLAQCA